MAWKFDTVLNCLLGYIKTPANIKKLFVFVGQWLFRVPAEKLNSAWDQLCALILDAKKEIPGAGQGEAKYQWVIDRAKDAGIALAPLVLDYLLHAALSALQRQGRKT
jgi:hypothetical protein